jgi:integrase
MPRLNGRIPAYRHHRASGQAIVTLNGRDHYLGPHGTQVSRDEYDRLVTEWLINGRRPAATVAASSDSSLTVEHVIDGFWSFAQIHYRTPEGTPTSELDNMRQALRPLRRLYGRTVAVAFGPRALKALREHMIGLGWCRTNINKHVSRIKSVFRWAVENEMVPPAVHQGLIAVRGLQCGRTTAPEPQPVRPVPEQLVRAVEPFVSRQVWALIQLQLHTGARAGELIKLRPVDLVTGGPTWSAQLQRHKTAHHGRGRRIYFGPQAQKVLAAFIENRPVDQFLFRPIDAEAERRAVVHGRRRTPLSCGNRPGSHCAARPARPPRDHYTVDTYRRAIERGCDLAFPPPEHLARQGIARADGKRGLCWETDKQWRTRLGEERWGELRRWQAGHRWHPHQLRHNAATHLRREFGIEVARIILGHRSAVTTEIYAELDEEKAEAAIQKAG